MMRCLPKCANTGSPSPAIRCGAFCAGRGSALRRAVFATEQDRPDVARRRAWRKLLQGRIDPERLVFIDETPDHVRGRLRAKTNMARTHGWHRRGRPLETKAPQGHWKAITFLAALRHDGVTAPFVLDGPIDGESFTAYVEQVLVPTLKPGGIVAMDVLGSHKGKAIRRLIRRAGARRMFLPPCSPDLNPIEQVFAKLQTVLRKAEERTVGGVWLRIGKPRDCFTPTECPNYLRNAEYASIQAGKILGKWEPL